LRTKANNRGEKLVIIHNPTDSVVCD